VQRRGLGGHIGDERGAVLPLMSIIIVILMGAAAMAIDLGWLFWQSIEIQHGADAAALAGVIYNYPSGQITDSTTWAASIEGNPVSLVE
jgi:Flp pilus assembly protein TadG